jgi:hypothetical protein
MQDSNYVKVYTGDLITVQRIVNDLEKIDISAVVKDDYKAGLSAVLVSEYPKVLEVFVNKDELDKALAIVQNVTSELQN